MIDGGYYFYHYQYCYYYSVTYTFLFIIYLVNIIANAFWNRVKFLMLYYCLKIGWFTCHLISLLLPIVFADHLLLKNKDGECIWFTQPICCILYHFLIQAFGFWASYVFRLVRHLRALMSFYLQSSIFLDQYSDLLPCTQIAVPSFHQIPVLLAPFSLGQIIPAFFQQVEDFGTCWISFLVPHFVWGSPLPSGLALVSYLFVIFYHVSLYHIYFLAN